MPKIYNHDELGEVTLTKRISSRHVRMSVNHDGKVRVSLPKWLPYRQAMQFVDKRKEWALEQQGSKPTVELKSGLQIGKYHRIKVVPSPSKNPTTRVAGNELKIFIPSGMDTYTPAVTKIAQRAVTKILKEQATQLLTQRLETLARQHGFKYNSFSVSNMKTRWGTCSSNQDITLNCYLMQMPWELIDYVILHELTHTRVMSHGAPFWAAMEQILPNTGQYRKSIKKYHPTIVFNVNA